MADYDTALAPYSAYINQSSQDYGVPASIIKGVILKESGGNQYATGSIGEQGLMQLTPKYYSDVQNRYDPQQNINAGTKSLAQYYQKYGNWEDALGYYNAGKNYQGSVARSYAADVMKKAGLSVWPDSTDSSKTKEWIDKAFTGREGVKTAAETGTLETRSPKEVFMGWLAGDVESEQAFKFLLRTAGLWILAFILIGFGLWRMING